MNFDTTRADLDKIVTLVTYAERHDWLPYDQRMANLMDMMNAHGNNGNAPLDLDSMVAAIGTEYERDLAHDLSGIRHHVDRETGELLDGFVPRFAISS